MDRRQTGLCCACAAVMRVRVGYARGVGRSEESSISLLTRSGTEVKPVAQITLPDQFMKRWRLGRMLGAGAMGTVYEATDLVEKRTVAIKFLTRIEDPSALSRFLLEGRLMQTIRHPCVLPVYEVQEVFGYPYLVTELVDGGTLRSLIEKERKLPFARAAALMDDVLAGLQACHALGVVHRDLKPENVLLTRDGRARLADLGIAKKYGDAPGATLVPGRGAKRGAVNPDATIAGTLLGTPRYMAPEQVRGEAAVVASDLHAAGVVLYELLCGQPPYRAPDLIALFGEIERSAPVELSRLVFGLPTAVSALVQRALSKRIAERPASAEEMAVALKKAAAAPPSAARDFPQRDDVVRIKDRMGAEKGTPDGAPVRDRAADAQLMAERLRPRPEEFRMRPPAPAPPDETARLREVARKNPQDARPHLELGAHHDKAGRTADAEACYRRAVQLDPRNAAALSSLGLLLARTERRDEAERRLRAAVAADPDLPHLHLALGDFLALDRPPAAAEVYRAGVKRAPDYNPLRYRLIVTLREHDTRAAKVALGELVRAEPANQWARVQLDELTGARERGTPLPAQGGTPAECFDRARFFERFGQLKEALAQYREAARDPAFAWAAYDAERLENLLF